MRIATLICVLALSIQTATADDYHVDAALGDDVAGDGSPALPWRTISRALRAMPSAPPYERHIWVAPGVYDSALGEVFPLLSEQFGETHDLTAVHGSGMESTVIRTDSATAFAPDGFELAGWSLTLQDLELDGTGAAGAGVDGTDNGVLLIRDCRIRGFGRALSLSTVIVPCIICAGGHGDSLSIVRSELIDNGVGVSVLGGTLTDLAWVTQDGYIANNLFVGNGVSISLEAFAEPGASMWVSFAIVNNTFVDSGSHALMFRADGVELEPAVYDNVITGSGGYGIDDPDPLGVPRVDFNDFWGNALGDWQVGADVGADNLFADPGFVDPAAGDYRLQPPSPCIDAGDPARVHPLVDLDGNPRPLDGDGDLDPVVDMGAYEYRAASGIDLRRADFVSLSPLLPLKSAAFPFIAANPLTPVVRVGFVSGDTDPTFDPGDPPLAFYQPDPDPGGTLLVIRDSSGNARFLLR